MTKSLKQIANTAASWSLRGKTQAVIVSPVAAVVLISIKASEITEDLKSIWDGNTFKNVNSRRPTK